VHTQGSKTFQYLEEKKTIVISLVAASEKERAQTQLHSHRIDSGAVGMLLGVVRRRLRNSLREELQSYLLTEASGKKHPRG
jgi:hypothetical protein